MAEAPLAGDIHRVAYPFIRTIATIFDEEGPHEILSWRPGVEFETRGGYGDWEGETIAIANGEGEMILTVIATFKPGRYPARVFYTRQWVSPEGKTFGKEGLRITTLEKFNRLKRGYRDAYDIEPYSGLLPAPRETAEEAEPPAELATADDDLPF